MSAIHRVTESGPGNPLVVIALDGGSGDLITRWAAEGRMPNLAALIDRGVSGDVVGPDSKIEHGAFVTLWSGVSRGSHGYHHFRQLEPGGYRIREVTGRDFPTPPFWTALKGSPLRAAVIDAPETEVVEGIEGLQLCDWSVHEPRHAPTASAPWVLREAREVFGPRIVIDQHPTHTPAQNGLLLGRYLDRIERRGRLLRRLLAKDRFDLIVVGFSETHTGGHQFWSYMDRPDAYGSLAYAVRSIYEAIDRHVGEVITQAGEDANVVVFGPANFTDCYPVDIIMETALERLGYARPRPQGFGPRDLMRRIIPQSWRKAVTGGLPRLAQEALVADYFADRMDWGRTTAFSIPGAHTSSVRVNLRGRDPKGTVEPGAEYEALLGRIEADLRGLTCVEDGLPVVNEVLRRSELFGPDAHSGLPDLFVNWRPAPRFFERVRHPSGEWTIPRPNWFRSSYHDDRGWYVAAGPSITGRGTGVDLDPVELAPLFLSLLELRQGDRAAEVRRKVA